MKARMEQALDAASRSPDPSTKVGAVIYTDGRYISEGCNDFPPGIPEEWWQSRALKYRAVVHAEAKAIIEAGTIRCHGGTIYVTAHPCRDCARLILASGLRKVVCPPGPWRDDPEVIASVDDAAQLFRLGGVEVDHAI